MQYTNNHNISLAVAVFLATDDYDHEPNVISATSLMKPVRQYVLAKRIPAEQNFIDVSTLVSSRMGTAIHTGIEKAWEEPVVALKRLGYPDKVANNVLINPTEEDLKDNPKAIPVYMEIRAYKKLLGYKVSGKFDFVGESKVQDFKSTSVYTYLNQTNVKSYATQLSIYRWLNPKLITKDIGLIHYFFTDWSAMQARGNSQYPEQRVLTQEIKLMSLDETQQYVEGKLNDIIKHSSTPEHLLPLCTDEELWRKEAVWKYYKDPTKTSRSTKNFDNMAEAFARYSKDGGVGLVKEIPGQVIRCKYCPAFAICTQKDSLIANGELIL